MFWQNTYAAVCGSPTIDFQLFATHSFTHCKVASFNISLIIQRCSMVKRTIWPPNHRSHTKVYFNEVVANALRGNIGIVNFGLRGYGGC